MVDEIDILCSQCDLCQRGNKKLNKTHAELHPIKVKEEVWNRIRIDLVGPLTETPRGNKYIVTCTDYFSKWPEAEALQSKEAVGVALFLYRLIIRYGVAEIVMSDQGREFVNQVNKELFTLSGTDHRISSAYHPQTNGLDERFNQTLSQALVKVINENQNDWDLHIDPILFAYRTSKNDTTKFSPFYLMFSRQPKLPIELEIPINGSQQSAVADAEPSFEEKVKKMLKIRRSIKAEAMANIEKAQERQKKYYDQKHKPAEFAIGDKVLLRNCCDDSRKGEKLNLPWTGPYTIIECLPKSLYRLKELKRKYNSSKLKKYLEANTEDDT